MGERVNVCETVMEVYLLSVRACRLLVTVGRPAKLLILLYLKAVKGGQSPTNCRNIYSALSSASNLSRIFRRASESWFSFSQAQYLSKHWASSSAVMRSPS